GTTYSLEKRELVPLALRPWIATGERGVHVSQESLFPLVLNPFSVTIMNVVLLFYLSDPYVVERTQAIRSLGSLHSFKVEKNVSGNHNSAFANPSYMPARNTNTGFHPPISLFAMVVATLDL
ncbi:hypothetical protein TNCV_4084191, partial [Trichonephila clavipes]